MDTSGFEKVRGVECLYRYRPNGKYYARFTQNGNEIRRSLRTNDRDTAKRELARLQCEQTRTDPNAAKLTVAGLCERFRATIGHQAPATIAQKKRICDRIKAKWPGGSDVLIRKVVQSQAQTFLSRHTFGASSYNTHLSVLRAMFALAVGDRLIADSPIDSLKERRREKPIRLTPTLEQFKAIIADVRAQTLNANAQDSADFVEFIGLSGLGRAEAASLTWNDIDFGREQIITFRHKTRTGFAVPLFPQLRPLLERLSARRTGAPNERVFAIRDAKKSIAGACRRLGLPMYSHRSFRRMFITRAIERGVDVKVIAEWQGHRDGGQLILSTYSHVRPVHSQRMAKLLTSDEPSNVVPMPKAREA